MKRAARSIARVALALLVSLGGSSCASGWEGEERDFRADMRGLVIAIATYAPAAAPAFVVIPQNGHELITADGSPQDTVEAGYLAEAHNFLYLLNPDATAWPTRAAYLEALGATRYDVLIIDLFFEDAEGAVIALGPDDLASIRPKPGGGRRPVICSMSIGEAEDYRFYWDPSWDASPPSWLAEENPLWPGNHKVEYWDPAWQAILFGSPDAYLDRIVAAGFDGAYLDIIDAYEYFEEAAAGN